MGNRRICNGILHIISTFLVGITLLGAGLSPSFAETSSEEDTYDIILEVKRDRKTLSTAIFGLEKNGTYYLPIQDLGRIVNFNTNTSLQDGMVTGFFISEENTYSINIRENTYTLRGESHKFDPDDAFIFNQKLGIGDIYVTPQLLNKIWPLDLSLNSLKQILQIQTTRKLPYEMSLARQRKRNNRLNRNTDDEENSFNLLTIDNNYKMFSLPAIDLSSTSHPGSASPSIVI